MNEREKDEIVKAYQHLQELLKERLPSKRISSLHSEVHLKLIQSRFLFEASWDDHEDRHLTDVGGEDDLPL